MNVRAFAPTLRGLSAQFDAVARGPAEPALLTVQRAPAEAYTLVQPMASKRKIRNPVRERAPEQDPTFVGLGLVVQISAFWLNGATNACGSRRATAHWTARRSAAPTPTGQDAPLEIAARRPCVCFPLFSPLTSEVRRPQSTTWK
jgi:hypothetical protein